MLRRIRLMGIAGRASVLAAALTIALSLLGVSYARYTGGASVGGVATTSACSDPFVWVASNDDGHLDYVGGYNPIDPGDTGGSAVYSVWGSASSDDPGSVPAQSPPVASPGVAFPRYDKDVGKTTAAISTTTNPDDTVTVTVSNAYPFYNPTVFFALQCDQGAATTITAINLSSYNTTALKVTVAGIHVAETVPGGQVAIGELGILVNEAAHQNQTYTMTLSITTECAPATTTGSAFAYGGNLATCFSAYGFNNWGWTNGPIESGSSYTWPIYAGAGQCDPSSGTLIGTLTVVYGTTGTVTVTYNMSGGAVMSGTELYVGNNPLPKKGNGYTVSPGKFPYKHTLTSATTDSYTITGISGSIYIVAHADVTYTP